MARIRRLLLIASFTALMTGAPALTTPAHACNGDVCDGICALYFSLHKDCPIR